MIDFLIYDAKVAVLIVVFYMFYRLMLARETFHRVNRVVLLLTAAASFVLPLCVITMHETVTIEPMPMQAFDNMQLNTPVAEPVAETPLWQILLPIFFIIGMFVTLGHTFVSMFRILMLIKRSEKHPQPDGTTICVSGNAHVTPFSWMHYIVMNQSDYAEQNTAILAHEWGHIRLKHSWDLLLVDTLTALQWFNPAMWMLRSDLRDIHEYEADGAVLSLGINARQYQYLLITKAAGIGGYSLANGISHSTLKNRINMMLHTKSNRRRLLKLLLLIPIVGIALVVNAEKVTDVVYTNAEAPSGESLTNEMIANVEPQSAEPEVTDDDKDKAFMAVGMIVDLGEATKLDGDIYQISEDNSTPIVGAVVQIEGTKKGTVTGPDGKFKLEVSDGDVLVAMYVGYETTKIVVNKAFSEAGNQYVIGLTKEGNTPHIDSNGAFDVVEDMPEFPGGPKALFEFLSNNIQYPTEAEKAGIQGRVIATFVVEKDGSITGIKLVKSVDPLLDAEALRVLNAMPKWIPGKQNGKTVRVKYTVPVTFSLQGDGDNAKKEKEYILEIDGRVVDDAEIGNIPSNSIDRMEVTDTQNGEPKRIKIFTKKKK